MPNPKTSEKSAYLDRDEHISRGDVGTKKVTVYYYDSGTDELKPINSTNPLPVSATIDTTGLATSAKQDAQTALLTTIDADTGTIATEVAGLLTDTELRATPVPVSGTVTATPTGTQDVRGNVASGASDSGNPVKIGGKYNATNPTLTDGQRGDIQLDSRSNQKVVLANGTNSQNWKTDNGDAVAVSSTVDKPAVVSRNTVFNGSTWDRMRGDATDGLLVNLGANNDVTVTSGAITETNSAAIKTAVETIDNAISGSEMQVDVVGALPAGTNAIGKLSANSGVDIGDVDVTSSVSATLDHGSNLDIDTTAEQITTTSFSAKFGITLKADITNTGIVYIGNSDVTAGTTAATDGFPLSAGETLTLEVNNSNIPYAIASAVNQKLYWIGV